MTTVSYHHGNLKTTLVETGIKFISTENIENLSLRKIAKICGVSNAAPYAHFKNKDEYINEMYNYVNIKFAEALELTLNLNNDNNNIDVLIKLGETYVHFFIENPHYYYFLFSKNNTKINSSQNILEEYANKPLTIFTKTASEILTKRGLPENIIQNKILSMWALVHGLANIATMPNQIFEIDWTEKTEEIIRSLNIL